jgi:multiple sugar transport system ATP-binding protein
MAKVSIRNVKKNFGRTPVIHGLDLEVADREFVVLVGPSGCGKSTMLRMIAGLEDISAGEIFIGDRLVNNLEPKARNIAMVFQNYALYPHMSVEQNIAFGLHAQRLSKEERRKRILDAATMLGLDKLLDRRPGELSGGQRQRVAMGRAIVRDPSVFLFDEPLSNLDAKLRDQVRTEIKKLHQRVQTTSIYVTHDQVEALTLADRIVIMRDGRIEQVGTPNEVYYRPANTFVATFIGSPAMNLMDADVVADGGAPALRIPGGHHLALPAERAARLQAGRPIRVGIRPQDLSATPAAGLRQTISLEAPVSVVEPMGGNALLSLDLGGQEITATHQGRDLPRPGDRLTVMCSAESLHLFDRETGVALA